MRSANLPQIDLEALYKQCIAQTQRNADRALLEGLTSDILKAAANYISVATASGCGGYQPIITDDNHLSLLKKLYDARLVDKSGAGRWAYEKIKSSIKFCPYCSFGEVYELDHFLSKKDFIEQNINPANLVPICHACNHIKLDKKSLIKNKYFLHPYFDKLDFANQWLFADIQKLSGGPFIKYRVESGHLPEPVRENLDFHFKELQLQERFGGRASQILNDLQHDIADNLSTHGPQYLKDHFAQAAAREFRRHGNTLEAAALQAASKNDDYCSGLYKC